MLYNIRRVRPCLTQEAAQVLIQALVISQRLLNDLNVNVNVSDLDSEKVGDHYSRVYRECSPLDENSSLMRGRRRKTRIVQANRRATNRKITALYNGSVQNSISERTTHRRPHRVPLLSVKNKKKRLQWAAIINTGHT
uniref:Transposase Tc1-like domain-containing protein n=1 Tax=Salmo trutta TaxID=8032 RepID=A0A673Y5J2_SALTR